MRVWRALVYSIVAMSMATPAAGQVMPVVYVHVWTHTKVSRTVLDTAIATVEQIFAEAGVEVRWSASRYPARLDGDVLGGEVHVALDLVDPPAAAARSAPPGALAERLESEAQVLGIAARDSARAVVFVGRLVEASSRYPVDLPAALAHVIAHELGHLMLPEGHAASGIMRPGIDLRGVAERGFTDDQARILRLAATRDAPTPRE